MEDDADKQLDRIFKILANRENDTIRPRTLTIKERNVSFNKTCGRVADCTFDELCDRVSGPILSLSLPVFSCLMVEFVPK